MNRRRRLTADLAMFAQLIMLFAVVARVDAAGNDTVASVVKAWKARQDHTRTLRFEWKEVRTLSRAMTPRNFTLEERKRIESLPDIVIDKQVGLSLDQEMVRYERHGPEWSVEVEDYVPGSYVGVFDGKDPKSLYRFDKTGKLGCSAMGYILSESRHPDHSDGTIRPILLVYRPFLPKLGGVDPASLSVSGDQGVINGRACTLITRQSPGSTSRTTFWVDPDRDYIIFRLIEEKDRRAMLTLDISYQRSDVDGWFPSAWTAILPTSSGKTALQFVAQVTRHEINQPIALREFQIEFPPGTLVADYASKSTFLVRADGEKRFVSRRERNARIPIAELDASETDHDLLSQGHLRLYVSLSTLAVLCAALLLVYMRRRIARRVM